MKEALLKKSEDIASSLAEGIRSAVDKIAVDKIVIMEVCGTHTAAIRKHGIRSLLPRNIKLVSGPGCPVCVTPASYIAKAIDLLENQDNVTIATFGDMLKVPDHKGRCLAGCAGAESFGAGGLAVVYSPADLLRICEKTAGDVVFLGIGFETTAPLAASLLIRAKNAGIENLYIYTAYKKVPPALDALLGDPSCVVDALILPGHVSAVIGLKPYGFIRDRYGTPAVVVGFDGLDLLAGILMLLKQIAAGRVTIENAYPRAVQQEGNRKAVETMEKVFTTQDAHWRGLGIIPLSGLSLSGDFERFDAEKHFDLGSFSVDKLGESEKNPCKCAEIIQGKLDPPACPFFGGACTPDKPLGPCMVSKEGACATWFLYGEDEV